MASMATNAGIRSDSVTASVAVILKHGHCLVPLTLLTLDLKLASLFLTSDQLATLDLSAD